MRQVLLVVPQHQLEDAEAHLSSGESFDGGEDCVYRWTADCGNGIEVDVKVVDADKENGGPWSEAVMFEHGSEIACTDVGEDVRGEWLFEDEGITITVIGSDEEGAA